MYISIRRELISAWVSRRIHPRGYLGLTTLFSTVISSILSNYGVSRGFNNQLHFHKLPFLGIEMWLNAQGAATHCSWIGHYINTWLQGCSKVVWVHTTFEPAIHHLLPRFTFVKPRFQLRDHSRKLSPEHVASPQWTMVVDIVILGEDLWSTAQICPLQNQWIKSFLSKSKADICFAIRASGFSNLKPPLSSVSFTQSEGSSDAWLLLIDD